MSTDEKPKEEPKKEEVKEEAPASFNTGTSSAAVDALFDKDGRMPCGKDDKFVALRVDDKPALLEKAVVVMADSFCGTKTTAPDSCVGWIFDGRSGDAVGQPLEEDPSDKRKAWFKYTMGFAAAYCKARRGVIALVEKDAPDTVVGAFACVPSTATALAQMDEAEQGAIVESLGEPPEASADEALNAREQTLMGWQVETGAANVPNGGHMYVMTMGVAPSAQGKGVGSVLLDVVSAMADADYAQAYLETCGKRNEHFYGKAGFAVVGERATLEAGDSKFEGIAAMLRPAKKETAEEYLKRHDVDGKLKAIIATVVDERPADPLAAIADALRAAAAKTA